MGFENLGVSIVGCTLIIGALIKIKNSKYKEDKAEAERTFWAREEKSNNVRRKDIADLDYIKIPVDTLPFVATDDYDINICQKEIKAMADNKILNLSGISNTDLKLQYGTANITLLSEYDENCTRLFVTLANLTGHLAKKGFHKEAVAFGEYAISIGSDVSRTYYVLADEYIYEGRASKIESLIEKAKEIKTPVGPIIIKELQAKL